MDRFWSKVNKDTESGCWEWTAASDDYGYGRMSIDGKTYRAHRLSYSMLNGPIPDGLAVMHSCDNTSCVNPDHLSVGTQAENLTDMRSKGRSNPPKGSSHPRAKLTETDIPFIRSLLVVFSQRKVARLYGVSRNSIRAIHSGNTWRHIA